MWHFSRPAFAKERHSAMGTRSSGRAAAQPRRFRLPRWVSWGPLVVAALGVTGPGQLAVAQSTCSQRLAGFASAGGAPTLRPDTELTALVTQFAGAAWRLILRRRPAGSTTGVGGFGGPADSTLLDSIAPRLERVMTFDNAAKQSAARALAEILGGSYTFQQAQVAAAAYDWWGLPPGPALAVLADGRASSHVRLLAIEALRPYWRSEKYRTAALWALCGLVDRASGLQEGVVAPDSATAHWAQWPLNTEEFALLVRLTVSLDAAPTILRGRLLRLRELIPRDNPIATFLRHNSLRW